MKKPDRRIKTEILIIGAGPAGMAAAMELSRAKKDFLIVERSPSVGGLSKTYTFKEGDLTFYTDNGPHRFFSKNPYLYEFIEDLLNEKWIKVNRQTRQYIDGKFYDYPVNAMQALRNLGPAKSVRMGFDYLSAKIRYSLFGKPVENFEDYVVANFGRSLGEFNMINYTEKIWGISAADIHPDWATQRIKGLDLFAILKDTLNRLLSLGSAKNKPKSLVDTFYYPERGTGQIYETIRERLESQGYKILFNTWPIEVRHSHNRISEVILENSSGETIAVECNYVVESVPITKFVKLLSPQPPLPVLNSLKTLRHRSQVYLFLTLDKESITADQWIYFPSKDTPIGRVSEMRNFSTLMSPPGKTSLFIEFFCFEGDETWKKSDQELREYAVDYLEREGFFSAGEVRNHYVIRQRDVYPIYDLEYKKYLADVKNYLDGFQNLYYIGRPGRFRYNNQDHSLEMGMLAAKSLIDGKRYDIEKVGEEKEYFEEGKLREKKASSLVSEIPENGNLDLPAPGQEGKSRPNLSSRSLCWLLIMSLCIIAGVYLFLGLRSVDSEIYISQIKYARGDASLTTSVEDVRLRAFKPLYALIGLALPFLSPTNVLIAANAAFMVGLIFAFYFLLLELGFTDSESLQGTLLFGLSYPTLQYGFALGTDISGWFFCIASMAVILAGIRKEKMSYLMGASLIAFLGALSKETGILGLFFGGLYICMHIKEWGWRKVAKYLAVLAAPAIVLEGIFLSTMIYLGFPSFLQWFAFNKDKFGDAYTFKFFVGGELITFNIFWLFVAAGLFALIYKKIEISRERKMQLTALALAALPVLKWPIFLDRVLNVQFFIIIPISLYGISYLSSIMQAKGWKSGRYLLLTLPIISSLIIIRLGGMDGIYTLRHTISSLMNK